MAGATALWACSYIFTDNQLLIDDSLLLQALVVRFREALAPLLPADKPRYTAVVAQDGPYRQTAEADLADVRSALDEAGAPPARKEELLAGYEAVRHAVVAHGDALDEWRQEAFRARTPPPKPEFPTVEIPAGLPGEIDDYLRGAVAYHQGDLKTARAAWQRLLDRPAAERRRRTTWAAFMLGRSAVESDPEEAVRWLRKTRELAAGFPDPLGLAAASLGWEARAEMQRKRLDEALKLYFQQYQTGDPKAFQSLRRACGKALEDPEGLVRVARSEEARSILTAFVLGDPSRDGPDYPLDGDSARKWLAALRTAGIEQVRDADRLAWLAYRAGDFTAAGEWLARSPADAPLTLWVHAKLLMREGRFAEAEPLLMQAVTALPPEPTRESEKLRDLAMEDLRPANQPRALGEVGAVRLQRQEYVSALDALARAGYWTDAAYVAERVLTLNELRKYVDAQWPERPAGEKEADWGSMYAGIQPPPASWLAGQLRSLLGRRLARAGRYREALPYLPRELRDTAAQIGRSLAAGRDARRSAAQRAASLFDAACRTRHQGLEVLGTELEPDWAFDGGNRDEGRFAEERANPQAHNVFLPTSDERGRVERSRTSPDLRFHYRYLAAGLAWQAAALLPNGSAEKARMLAVAGSWLKNEDPEAADRFYKRLVRCCANTELGHKADDLRWFPEVEDCGP
jgi:tetratricopeptide (TPR) repeat protein